MGKGYAHDCTRRGKVSNIQHLLAATPTSAQRYASGLVSELDHPFLATLGSKPMQVTTGPVPTKKKLFTTDDMSIVLQDLSLSNQQVKTIAEDMRTASESEIYSSHP